MLLVVIFTLLKQKTRKNDPAEAETPAGSLRYLRQQFEEVDN